MIVRHWAGRADAPEVSALGFGTTRFLPEDLKDAAGLARCVELVEYALEKGINYFDVAPTYSSGFAESILGRAFQNHRGPVYVAGKSGLMLDKTADEILRRIDASLEKLRVPSLEFYSVWSVMSYEEYLQILQPDGIYEGVLRAKEAGLIRYPCISLHCSVPEVLKIIEDGRFEGITISVNAANLPQWRPVLKAAKDRRMGIATMNSLAGGMIPSYPALFEGLDETGGPVSVKALRLLRGVPEVDVILSGMRNRAQVDENCSAFEEKLPEVSQRDVYAFRLPVRETLCTGCGYCMPCTVGIPIPSVMQAYNHKILLASCGKRMDEQALVNSAMIRMRANGVEFPDLSACIACGKCEKRCTNKLPLRERIGWLSRTALTYHYTRADMRSRLRQISEACKDAGVIGIWPSCAYSSRALDLMDDPDFEARCVFINQSPEEQGKLFRGKRVHHPEEIPALGIDVIVVMNYRFQREICQKIQESGFSKQIAVVCLHQETDINWFDRDYEPRL